MKDPFLYYPTSDVKLKDKRAISSTNSGRHVRCVVFGRATRDVASHSWRATCPNFEVDSVGIQDDRRLRPPMPLHRREGKLIDWFMEWLNDWLIFKLVNSLGIHDYRRRGPPMERVSWLIVGLIDWLLYKLVDSLGMQNDRGRGEGKLIDWFMVWLIDWLLDWFID